MQSRTILTVEEIKKRLESANLSGIERITGISRVHVSNIKKGKAKNLRYETLVSLSDALSVIKQS